MPSHHLKLKSLTFQAYLRHSLVGLYWGDIPHSIAYKWKKQGSTMPEHSLPASNLWWTLKTQALWKHAPTPYKNFCLFFCQWIDALPVYNKGQRPLNNVVKWKCFQTAESEFCGICTDNGFLLFCFYGQDSQELCNEVMGHQVNL